MLVVILVAIAVLCVALWVGEGPLWRWVMLRTVGLTVEEWDGGTIVGWYAVRRWEPGDVAHGKQVFFFRESGLKAHEGVWQRGWPFKFTSWNSDGSVKEQYSLQGRRESPPWLWGVTDQTEPTAPWWEEEKAKRMDR